MIIKGEITHTIKMADFESLKITWSAEVDTKEYSTATTLAGAGAAAVEAIQQTLDDGTRTDLRKACASQDPDVFSYLHNWVTGEERERA